MSSESVRIGIDFDNTIVSYDELFHELASERDWIPAETPRSKGAVRDQLRSVGREDDWTELQGIAYGPELTRARPFAGALQVMSRWIEGGATVFVISHKTRYPYRGPRHDLHAAALAWLESHDVFDKIGLPRTNALFNLTLQEKLGCIGSCRCDWFIDDLPELLAEPEFPERTRRVLFDPNDQHAAQEPVRRATSWARLEALVRNP